MILCKSEPLTLSVCSLSCRAGEEKKGVAILQCFTMLQNRFTVGFDLHGSPMDRHHFGDLADRYIVILCMSEPLAVTVCSLSCRAGEEKIGGAILK